MKTSCINHPEHDILLVMRGWQVEACEGNHCAAALLSFFEYWHNVKLAQREQADKANAVATRHGDKGTQDTHLLQFHNAEELQAGILHFYGRNAIDKAIAFLVGKHFISLHSNPTARYKFDKTRYVLFHPDAVNLYLKTKKVTDRLPESNGRLPESNGPIPKITSLEREKISHSSSEIPRDSVLDSFSLFPPEEFGVTDGMRAWAAREVPTVDLEYQTALFRDHEFAKPYRDWRKAWYNWMRRAGREFAPRAPTRRTTFKDMASAYAEIGRQIAAEEAARGLP